MTDKAKIKQDKNVTDVLNGPLPPTALSAVLITNKMASQNIS